MPTWRKMKLIMNDKIKDIKRHLLSIVSYL